MAQNWTNFKFCPKNPGNGQPSFDILDKNSPASIFVKIKYLKLLKLASALN